MRITYREDKITKRNVHLAVRRIFVTYRKLWKMRYGVKPAMTAKQRATLADALFEIEEEKIIHEAVARYLRDESGVKTKHSFSWFLAVINNYLVDTDTEVTNGKAQGRRLSKCSDSEFEDEIKKAKARRKFKAHS